MLVLHRTTICKRSKQPSQKEFIIRITEFLKNLNGWVMAFSQKKSKGTSNHFKAQGQNHSLEQIP